MFHHRPNETEYSGAPDTITLRAKSANLIDTFKQQQEHSFHKTTLGAIIEAIAFRNELASGGRRACAIPPSSTSTRPMKAMPPSCACWAGNTTRWPPSRMTPGSSSASTKAARLAVTRGRERPGRRHHGRDGQLEGRGGEEEKSWARTGRRYGHVQNAGASLSEPTSCKAGGAACVEAYSGSAGHHP